jgi:hypothetical protein
MKKKLTEKEIREAIELEIKSSLKDGGYYEKLGRGRRLVKYLYYDDICIQQQMTNTVLGELYDRCDDNDVMDYYFELNEVINSLLDEYENDLDKINEMIKKNAREE